ncbi:YARHG domain-containing protein [Cellulophaga sp. L1A9]|uniref:YARHG domain-containing protein n=1 Tax=Cellulophaga sp. L1A9 TaxID=2686362 RepID=UPI00131C5FFF|nr:YARHG domain-containing protein [Cellulophaga sp. L1A9]
MKKFILFILLFSILSCKGQTESKEVVSSFEYLTEEILKTKSKKELRLLRNEVFARKGHVFKSEDLIEYFNKKAWYKPNPNISLSFTEKESSYTSKIKTLEEVENDYSIVNCINYYDHNNSKVYPLSGSRIENDELPNGLIDIELSHNSLKPQIKEILFDGSIFNLDCLNPNKYRFIITAYPNQNLHSYLVIGDLIEIKKLYGSFGPYDNHKEYDFVLNHKDLEITIEDWERDKKVSTKVEKYKLTDTGLVKL